MSALPPSPSSSHTEAVRQPRKWAERPWLLLTFVAMILLVRGGVVWLREEVTPTGSGLTTHNQRLRLALYTAAGLPIIVAVTEVAVESDLMPEDAASVLVAAGIITVLAFPMVARVLPADRASRIERG